MQGNGPRNCFCIGLVENAGKIKLTKKITVGLETRLLSGAMTGIGNYCFHLLQALTSDYPDLSYIGFGLRSWNALDAGSLKLLEREHEERSTAAKPSMGRLKRAIRVVETKARSRLARLGLAQSLYRSRFSRTVKHQSLDLFHAFNYVPVADPGVLTLPVVYDLSFVRFPQFHPADRLRVLEHLPLLLERSPRVQTISQFSRNEIATVYGYDRDRIFVAPPAAASIFKPLGLESTRRDLVRFDALPGKYLLSVGTLEPRKNLRTLVSAYGRLTKATRDLAPLLVVGGAGWGELNLPAETSALVGEGNLRFLGSVTNRQLRSLYEGAIVLAYPSIYEGFGMPVVEAMACGTSVVHSADTSMDEIGNGLAMRVAATDVEAWSEALNILIERSRSGSNVIRSGLMAQAATFDWNRSAALVRQTYAKLIDFK
jgi:glycosyltransferase involved in cell wall biosynthesis